jgi:hypothetical protein
MMVEVVSLLIVLGKKILNGKNGGDLECSTEKIGLVYDV